MRQHIFLFVFFCFSIPLFSQNNDDLQLNLTNESGSRNIDIEFNITANLTNGVFIKLPPAIKPVVKSISIDDTEMWLLNKNIQNTNANVIVWFPEDEGIVLKYQNDVTGSMLVKLTYDYAQLDRLSELTVELHEISVNNLEVTIQDIAYLQSSILLQNNSQDE